MAVTPNKGLLLMTTGSEVNTWGDKLNAEVFTVLDSNLGGIVSKSLGNTQVNLTADESENLRLILSGNLTGNVLVSTQCVGFTVIENHCTGNFAVTFQKFNGVTPVGTPINIPNGTNNLVVTGLTGDPQTVGIDFPAGTRIPFQQTTPPPGYSKDLTAALNNSAMRIVTGAVVNGGSLDFSAVFASRTPTGGVQAMTLDISQIPSHQHGYVQPTLASSPTGSGATRIETTTAGLTDAIGGGGSHNHGLTLNAMDFSVRFYDFCIGVKS